MTKRLVRFFWLGLGIFLGFFIWKAGFSIFSHKPSLSFPTETMIVPAVVDSLNDITKVPSLQSGTIKTMNVTAGQFVKKGQILFSLENGLAANNVNIQEVLLAQAESQLHIAEKKMHHDKIQLARLRNIDKRSISKAELQDQIYAVNIAHADLKNQERQVVLAKANLQQALMTLKQYTMLAPKDGIVLQINAHEDEFVGASQPIIILGDRDKVMVRLTLDERDMQRFNPTNTAYLTCNNDKKTKIPLHFMQLNRYVVTQERSNFSRVQEAIYYFNRHAYKDIVAGQQLDAHIIIKTEA